MDITVACGIAEAVETELFFGAAAEKWAKLSAAAKAVAEKAAATAVTENAVAAMTAKAAYEAAKAAAEKAAEKAEKAAMKAAYTKAAAETAATEKDTADKTAAAARAAWKRKRDVFGEYSPSTEDENAESSDDDEARLTVCFVYYGEHSDSEVPEMASDAPKA